MPPDNILINIDPSDQRPIYVQIVDEVRRSLVLGLLKPDTALPSVRQLAGTLRVNPNTVSQAYRELEREGLAYVRRGEGTFVNRIRLNGDERRVLATAVATRALQDAFRNGMNTNELIEAICTITNQQQRKETP
ncbi:MAG TPA: GntR family transcriptional regulator [Gemmatimonadaceae bacterium]|jgi:GntR family transcriptional regulator|nr:GntR family transcriptional regulator [Gemmatimonadaceae bacterium]